MIHKNIRKAVAADTEQIYTMYQSLLGTPGCAWDETYPSREHVQGDIRREALYCLYDDENHVIAAAAVEEHDGVELKRVGVRRECQGKGAARELVSYIISDLKRRGCKELHLMAAQGNPGALRLYEGLDFVRSGEARLYDTDWYVYSLELISDDKNIQADAERCI